MFGMSIRKHSSSGAVCTLVPFIRYILLLHRLDWWQESCAVLYWSVLLWIEEQWRFMGVHSGSIWRPICVKIRTSREFACGSVSDPECLSLFSSPCRSNTLKWKSFMNVVCGIYWVFTIHTKLPFYPVTFQMWPMMICVTLITHSYCLVLLLGKW